MRATKGCAEQTRSVPRPFNACQRRYCARTAIDFTMLRAREESCRGSNVRGVHVKPPTSGLGPWMTRKRASYGEVPREEQTLQ